MLKKYSSILAVVILSSTVAVAQDYNKWSVGVNVGGHYGSTPTTVGFKTAKISHYGINGRYMMNNRVGIMLDLGYDSYSNKKPIVPVKNHYVRTSLQGVANLGDILMFDTWTKHIGLLVHAGVGGSVLFNDKSSRTNNVSKKTDKMLNGIIGITPQVKLGERVSLNVDVSYITHAKQNYSFDMLSNPNPIAFRNYLVNWSVGATFYLGKHQTHADWFPTEYGSTPAKNDYEERVKKLEEQLGDNDGDGVFNYKDDEPDTPEGNEVDSRGVTIVKEVKPTETEGSTEVGTNDLDGTDISAEDKDAIKNALKQVNFEYGSANLSAGSKEKLAAFAEVLKRNPKYNLSIEGHTDNISSAAFNQTLSEKRAKSVYDVLLSEGVTKNRMSTKGFGKSKPKVPNDSDKNRAINRRVELIFIQK